jgi:hypothetical protein
LEVLGFNPTLGQSGVPTLIHVVFLALAINYANQGYMNGRAILTTKNIVVNSLNTQIVEVVPGQEHIFLSTDLVETGG